MSDLGWNATNTLWKGWACVHDDAMKETIAQDRKKAFEHLSNEFNVDPDISDGDLITLCIVYLGAVEIHGDMWFRVIYHRNGRRASIQCDRIVDGLLQAVVWSRTPMPDILSRE